jgi:transmembrane sensor
MSKLTAFPDLEEAREEASLWVAKLDRGLDATEQEQLRQWLRQPANRRAFDELSHIWGNLDVMSVLADLFPRHTQPRRSSRTLWIATGALAASVLAAAIVLRVAPLQITPVAPPATQSAANFETFATPVGEHRSVTLRDGSLLSLNTDTVVDVSIAGAQRQLTLRRGEAHFEVAHDTARPFIVTAGDHAVRAVGTAFNIRLRGGNAADVLVTSGTVRVSPAGTGSSNATVTAGQLLELRTDGSVRQRQLDAAAVESLLAWRRSVLIFDGETLAEALQEISRYTQRHIRLADSALGQRRIVGYFPANDLPVLLKALEANFDLKVTQSGSDILLSAGRDHEPPE